MRTIHSNTGEKISTNPMRYIIAGLIIVGLFFGGFGTWAVFGKMEGAIIAPGYLKVEKNRKDVQHLEGGIVEKIWVQDGDHVVKGQKLLTLQSARIKSSVDMLKGQWQSLLATKSRLEAERNQESRITWPNALLSQKNDPEVRDLMRAEQEVFDSQRKSLNSQTHLLNTQVEQIKQQIIGLREQAASEDNIIRVLKEELNAKQELVEDRYLEKPPVLALERELASHQGRRSALKGEIAQNLERITEIRVQANDLTTRYVERATGQLSETQSKLFDLEDRIKPMIDAKKRLDIVAPASGVVVDIRVFSEGGVVKPGEVLMQIVPQKEQLIIECNVRPTDIAKVYMSQPARVELNAFNRREVDPVDGTVIYVSADSVLERTPYGEQPMYKAHVEINPKQVKAQELELTPGMPVTVFLSRGERTFLDYIMEPLIENFRRALRE
jgi:HlyD family type I secretion membrane fusion protein